MREYDLIIKRGTVVTASDAFKSDVAVKDGIIVALGQDITGDGTNIIDAEGKYVFPGGIDVHTHLEMPFGGTVSSDDFETGTIAAACGGTTTIIDFAMQAKGQSLQQAAETWHKKADGKAVIDYGFHIAITDMNEDILNEMPRAIKNGYSSFKLFMTYDGLKVNDDVLLKALIMAKENGGLICVHAENYYIIDYLIKKFYKEGKIEPKYHAMSRPTVAEAEAVSRAIKIASFADAPLYIVHLSCKESLIELVRAREQRLPVMAETCPQYLLLSEERYEEPNFMGAKYVMSPPLRPKENLNSLWDGLAKGEIQAVSTDHCPFFLKGQKDLGLEFFGKIPNGAPGIETRMALMYSYGADMGKLSLQRFVEITATNPAKIFGLYPSKGTIAVGSDADIVIFDPNVKEVITKSKLHENVDYTPYEGFEVTGYPVITISKGNIIVENGNFIGRKGSGKFLKRQAPILV
ncbi:MAG: dihydropyrimidinase [Thermoanaerobacterium sp.]|nr:dihydropyrimidinase [Thermoanaerobacterium sp.]